MRRPYDLMSFLQQENRADKFSSIKNQLMMQKEEIESESCMLLFLKLIILFITI